ncbi:MAG: OsmC family peroxiredoxin [Bacteroidetes bacterium]|nr:MAG: OsmC family peroxiredoxin [Bacteroidota bacterium]
MTSEVTYTGDLRTEAVHLRSGNRIITDAPVDNRGKGEAFSPTDLVATALASCMLTIMGIRARDKGWAIEGTRATVNKIMASNPRRIARVEIDIHLPSGKTWTEEQRQTLEEAARTCPVCRSLHPDLEVAVQFHWD